MTDRQKRILGMVRPHMSEMYAACQREMLTRQIGETLVKRLVTGFNQPTVSMHIVKLSDGFKFQIQNPYGLKGWSQPKWRRLLEVS